MRTLKRLAFSRPWTQSVDMLWQERTAAHTEAEEIVAEAKEFFDLVERWIAANHPKFAH
jgi:hypothetical protein